MLFLLAYNTSVTAQIEPEAIAILKQGAVSARGYAYDGGRDG
jgi:hypothetical protein